MEGAFQKLAVILLTSVVLIYAQKCNRNLQKCPCMERGQGYYIGELVYRDKRECLTCECMKGGVECLKAPCPKVDCYNPVYRPGECCPECGCVVDGYLYDLGDRVFSENPCTDCRCEYNGKVSCTVQHSGPIKPSDPCRPCRCNSNGQVTCDKLICPKMMCSQRLQYVPYGGCCPVCSCYDKYKWFDVGDKMPVPDNDACAERCVCGEDGKRLCDKRDCPKVNCLNPLYIPSKCCAVCGCLDKNNNLQGFGTILPTDKCRTCTCNNDGKITCAEPDCLTLACISRKQYTPDGECCRRCRCIDKTTWFEIGDEMPLPNNDPCTERCICGEDGQPVCENTVCPEVSCINPVYMSGQCCPVCGCADRDKVVHEFGLILPSDKCNPCTCNDDGMISCLGPECPDLSCIKRLQYTLDGECCPVCRCLYKAVFYDIGLILPSDLCNPCTCNDNGSVTCLVAECPDIPCSRRLQFTPDGECCPICRCLLKEIFYDIGAEMPLPDKDNCVDKCYCGQDGDYVCDNAPCPELDCENPVSLKGACCPQCGCLDKKNIVHDFGLIKDDPCQTCECLPNSSVSCSERQMCPNLKCVKGLYQPEAGETEECCQQCRCKLGNFFYKPGETFAGPKCTTCLCHASTGRVSCEKIDCSHVTVQCANPTIFDDCCPSCPDGPTCMYKTDVILYGEYKVFGDTVCTCIGEPWFPNAFCTSSEISTSVASQYADIWDSYGYDTMEVTTTPKHKAKKAKAKKKKRKERNNLN